MSKIYGDKVLTDVAECRFVDLAEKNDKGSYQIEIVMPIEKARELSDKIYGDNQELININKKTPKAKKPTPLFLKVPAYDEEAGEKVFDEDGEIVYREDIAMFRAKTMFEPKVQFKKTIKPEDRTLDLGMGSKVQLSINAFSSTTTDDSGKPIRYTLLSLNGVRVHEIVEKNKAEDPFAGVEDDDFEEEEFTEGPVYDEEEPKDF